MNPQFHYLSPLLFPLFAIQGGQLVLGLNLQQILFARAIESVTGKLYVRVEEFRSGHLENSESLTFDVKAGVPDTEILWREFEMGPSLEGYVEVTISADDAVFRKIDLPVGYSAIKVQGYGSLTIIPDAKFARPTIIKQIQETRTFCLVHTSCRWDDAANYGTSIFFVNPYANAIVATISSMDKKIKKKVGAKQTMRVPLNELLNGNQSGTIMITGSNRIPAWVVSHNIEGEFRINNVDHLDLFRGDKTHRYMAPLPFVKSQIRRLLRRFGQVY